MLHVATGAKCAKVFCNTSFYNSLIKNDAFKSLRQFFLVNEKLSCFEKQTFEKHVLVLCIITVY